MIDIYCERLTPGLLAEPVNAATNLAFFVAAWFAWRLARQSGSQTPSLMLLIGLLVAIGTGSLLFHTFANRWSMFADVLPILFFQATYLWVYTARVMRWNLIGRIAAVATWLLAGVVFAQAPEHLNGSLAYAPALIALVLLGGYHARHVLVERFLLLQAAGLLLLSLTLRTLDPVVCGTLPLGTHFLWHLVNGVVLYLSLRALLLHDVATRAQQPGTSP
jgi:hypothetical protein